MSVILCMPGWHSERSEEGGLRATRISPLTDYQLLNGCLEEIVAMDEGELWLLCDAQTRLAERVATAERLRATTSGQTGGAVPAGGASPASEVGSASGVRSGGR
ncbi:hypothetical protein E1264_36610 [Actinomadura sp. KC216]|uniref:hypothetical protein n=1 Tax=Actinomadura sp. KC216 TaxID=2530370 RepID=UPI001047F2B9|nr:hypothetical protein [Actinomadura sp. KC216]TDB78678.1 hypothetical protein E1264_36610 [Actinomadura sp. KC216]